MSNSSNSIKQIPELFTQKYGRVPLMFRAPGRINLIGEHTDYNDGYVLPAAINRYIYLAIQKNGTSECNLCALDMDETFSFSLTRPLESVSVNWANYFIGVTHYIRENGGLLSGFDMMFSSTIPVGSGLSSSAALESSFALGLDTLFDVGLSLLDLAKIGQAAEHTFVGVQCGIMDQYASCLGKKGEALLIDCQKLTHKYTPCDLGDYTIVLFDSNVKHNLADSEYNIRRQQCEEGVSIIQKIYTHVQSLRDVTLDSLKACKHMLSDVVYNRCQYIIEENERVLLATEALQKEDVHALGRLLYDGHTGMQYLYEITCDEVDLLVQLAKNENNIIGARMMGGGFGGCTINLIHNSHLDEVTKSITREYTREIGFTCNTYIFNTTDGACQILSASITPSL